MAKRIVFFSSRGPGNFQTALDFCFENPAASVAHLICDRAGIPSLGLAAFHGIPASVEPIDGKLRPEDHNSVCDRIAALRRVHGRLLDIESSGGPIDLIILAFRKVLLGPILERFGRRMINIHPSDLSVHNIADRRRRYVGIHGLKRAIADGNTSTRTTIHRVDDGVDTGELLCLGPSIAFCGDRASDRDIERHENVQKERSDKVALRHTLHCWLRDDLSSCAVL